MLLHRWWWKREGPGEFTILWIISFFNNLIPKHQQRKSPDGKSWQTKNSVEYLNFAYGSKLKRILSRAIFYNTFDANQTILLRKTSSHTRFKISVLSLFFFQARYIRWNNIDRRRVNIIARCECAKRYLLWSKMEMPHINDECQSISSMLMYVVLLADAVWELWIVTVPFHVPSRLIKRYSSRSSTILRGFPKRRRQLAMKRSLSKKSQV